MTGGIPTEQVGALDEATLGRLTSLEAAMAAKEACLVAFSGGVDSSLIAAVAVRVLGPWDPDTRRGALAVLADSSTLARRELDLARTTAATIGIPLQELAYSEFDNPEWAKNDGMRCYHCKKDLAVELRRLADRYGLPPDRIAFGITVSDLGDHRPGIRATEEEGTWRPLVDAGLDKAAVRAAARHLEVPVWDKPATPCLSSRVQYGEGITPETLARVEAAEEAVRGLGFSVFRVRHHDSLARVEVPEDRLADALAARAAIVSALKDAGYTYVTLDLAGFRSGAMNEALPEGGRRLRLPVVD